MAIGADNRPPVRPVPNHATTFRRSMFCPAVMSPPRLFDRRNLHGARLAAAPAPRIIKSCSCMSASAAFGLGDDGAGDKTTATVAAQAIPGICVP
jgi:hypothetical protein